jgi:hypothetical protein
MKRSLVVLSLVSLVFAGVVSAEVKKGDVQLDAYAGWTQQKIADNVGFGVGQSSVSVSGDVSVFFGAIRPGYALTDNIRVAGVAGVANVSLPTINSVDPGSVTAWLLGASAEYVFMPANTLNPYIGGMIAYATADKGAGNGVMYAPRVGALYTLNQTNNLFGEFQYQLYTGDIGDVLDHGYMIMFGLEHKFVVGR